MPQTPEDLSRLIIEMARRHASNYGKKLSDAAAERIGRVPEPYRSQSQISVDQKLLDRTIEKILKFAASYPSNVIELQMMERALEQAPCHYLWLC